MVKQPSWQTAHAVGESAKQASTNGMRRNARKDERFTEFFNGRVVVFIMRRGSKNLADLARRNRPVRRQIAQKFGNVAFNEIARTPIAVKRNEIPNPGHLRSLGVQLFRRRRMNRPI